MGGGAILLSVLRVLGLVLLALLALLLVILLAVLFVPIRYRVKGRLPDPSCHEAFGDEERKALLAGAILQAEASWLLRLVRFSYCYPGEGGPELYALCFRILPRKGKKEENQEQEKEKKPKEPEKSKKKAKPSLSKIVKLLASDETKTAVRVILERSGKLLRGILPGQWELTGTVGLGDPGNTGKLMEAEALIYPAVCGHVWVMPCMEGYRFDLSGEARGKICLGRILWIFVGLWMQKEVRGLVHRITELRSGE